MSIVNILLSDFKVCSIVPWVSRTGEMEESLDRNCSILLIFQKDQKIPSIPVRTDLFPGTT